MAKWNNNLAVVIPAFKVQFISKTLESLCQQVSKDFTVYVGNDGGDTAIEEIVNGFRSTLNIKYRFFENNLGKSSLVRQWERCLKMIEDEEWIWLLPDDDYADPECVALFYTKLHKSDFDLFRFNVSIVNEEEIILKTNPFLPPVQSSFDSLVEKLSFYRSSSIAEYIFNRRKFESIGFAEIPMAWGTDDLLWYELGAEKGIVNCNDASVYLRQSTLNISNNYVTLRAQKIEANFIFFKKLIRTEAFRREVFSVAKKKQFAEIALNHIMYNLQDFTMKLNLLERLKYAVEGNEIWGGGVIKNMRRFWLNNKRIPSSSNDESFQ